MENQHETLGLELQDIVKILMEKYSSQIGQNIAKKLEIIRGNGIDQKLFISESEGLSWNVKMVLKILALAPFNLNSWHQIYNDTEGCGDETLKEMTLYIFSKVLKNLKIDILKMESFKTQYSDSFSLCYNLVISHKVLVEKALVNI